MVKLPVELEKRKAELGHKPLAQPKKAAITTNTVERNTGKLIVALEDVSFGYGEEKSLFKDLDLDIRFGQKPIISSKQQKKKKKNTNQNEKEKEKEKENHITPSSAH